MNAHADMFIVVDTTNKTHQGAFIALLFRACEILQDFCLPKQAPINAFYNMSSCLTSVSDGMLVSYKLYNAINADWRI